MLVLSGVFNTTILDAPNYVNQAYTLIVVYSMLLVTGSQSKKRVFVMFLPGYGPIAIADWSIIVQWVLASIDAVVEMGVLSTLKRLIYMESTVSSA
jgi:hypothetical protein